MEDKPLEQVILKGVSIKLMATIIIATVTICGTFIGTYYRFQNELSNTVRDVSIHGASMKEHDLRLQQLQLQINTLEVRLSELEKHLKH